MRADTGRASVGGLAVVCALALCGTAWSAPPSTEAQGPPPAFGVGVQNVNIDVLVSRAGRRVDGLRPADFVVTDQGVVQDVEMVGASTTPVDAVLALDMSASVAGDVLAALQKGAHAFVDALAPADSLTLLGFSTDLTLALHAGAGRAEAHAAIDRFHGAGATTLVDAVHGALLLSDPRRGRPLVLVFSDGEDRGSWLSAESVLDEARATDAVVDTLEAPAPRHQAFLSDLVKETGGRGWRVGREADLGREFATELEEFRSRYRLRYEPRGVRPGGWHELHVRLKDGKAEIRARRGYRSRASDSDAATTTPARLPPRFGAVVPPTSATRGEEPGLDATGAGHGRVVPEDMRAPARGTWRAAAVLHLDAAARLLVSLPGDRRQEAVAEMTSGRRLLERRLPGLLRDPLPREIRWTRGDAPPEAAADGNLPDSPDVRFAVAWLTAAGYLQQSVGEHGAALQTYLGALRVRPAQVEARLGWATALEPSVLPDGFGTARASDREMMQVLASRAPLSLHPSEDAMRDGHPVRERLLAELARQYRAVLEAEPSYHEARLRLGRVLVARGERAAGTAELRAVAGSGDLFAAGLAHLCLARRAESSEGSVPEYRAAIDVDPSLRVAWLGLSHALSDAGWRSSALEALDQSFVPLGGEVGITTWLQYHLGRARAFPAALEALRASAEGEQ